MTPVWLCLFVTTYFFSIYALENPDQGNTPEMKIKNQIRNLIGVDAIPIFKKLLDGAPLENAVKSSEFSKESSATEKVADESNPNFSKNPMNFIKLLMRFFTGNAMPKVKRDELLNEDVHLPINRLLDVTDRLFNHTASIDNMVQNQQIGMDPMNMDHQTQFTPIYEESPMQPRRLTVDKYTNMLEEIFVTPDNSTPQAFSNGVSQNQDEEKGIQLSSVAVPKNIKNWKIRMDGPLVSNGLLIIEKIKKVILHLLRILKGNREVEGRVFAASALAAFTLAISVSATRAFYFGYNISERICKFLTGNNGLTTCNPLSFFTFDRLGKGILDIVSVLSKRFLNISGFSLKLK